MQEVSVSPRRAALVRLGVVVAVWAAFALAAHEFVHRYLFEIGPIPGSGLTMLGAQAFAVALATLALLALLRPARFISLRAIVATTIWVILIVFGHYLSHLEPPEIRASLEALREGMGMGALVASAAMLAVLMGLPFIPSLEMALLMMAVFGRDGALAAWLAGTAGISMAFAAGRYMPVDWLHGWLERHHLAPASGRDGWPGLTALIDRTGRAQTRRGRVASFVLRHRYILFALLLNMPGNSVLGGGGGIALVSGFTRLYRWPLFLLTTLLALAPVPLLVFLGLIQVDQWLGASGGG